MSKPLPLVIKEATLQQLTKPFPQFCNQCHAWIYSISCKVSMLKTLYKKSKKRFSWYNKKKKNPTTKPEYAQTWKALLYASKCPEKQLQYISTQRPWLHNYLFFQLSRNVAILTRKRADTCHFVYCLYQLLPAQCSPFPLGNTWQFVSPLRSVHRATWGEESIEDRHKTMVSCLEVS